jgi:hypothetical protein
VVGGIARHLIDVRAYASGHGLARAQAIGIGNDRETGDW